MSSTEVLIDNALANTNADTDNFDQMMTDTDINTNTNTLANTTFSSDTFDFDPDFDMNIADINLDVDFSTLSPLNPEKSLDIDLFGEPLATPASITENVDMPSTPIPDIALALTPTENNVACEKSDIKVEVEAETETEIETLAPSPSPRPQTQPPPHSPSPHTPSPTQPTLSPKPLHHTPRSPPQKRLPPGRSFAPIPNHITLIRTCSPPPRHTLLPKSRKAQVSRHPALSGLSPVISPTPQFVGRSNMGPPPPGPLIRNTGRTIPISNALASPYRELAPKTGSKRKADAFSDMETIADHRSDSEAPKRRRLDPSTPEGKIEELEIQEREAMAQAMRYRDLRNRALGEAAEYKRLGDGALKMYKGYKKQLGELRG